MEKTGNVDINDIVKKVKEDVRKGVAGKTMTITDISLAMTEAINEIQEAFVAEIGVAVTEGKRTDAESCPECGEPLKKTAN